MGRILSRQPDKSLWGCTCMPTRDLSVKRIQSPELKQLSSIISPGHIRLTLEVSGELGEWKGAAAANVRRRSRCHLKGALTLYSVNEHILAITVCFTV